MLGRRYLLFHVRGSAGNKSWECERLKLCLLFHRPWGHCMSGESIFVADFLLQYLHEFGQWFI